MTIWHLNILVFVKIIGLSSEKLQKFQFLKSDWELIEREEASIIRNPQAGLVCAIKCSDNEECAGSVYQNLSGKRNVLNNILYT